MRRDIAPVSGLAAGPGRDWPVRQHGEEIDVADIAPPAPQLGRVIDDASDPGADQRPVAEVIGAHQLADPERERDVGVQRPVGVGRCVECGRRTCPDGYPPPGRLQLIRDLQEAVRERRVHDDHGMDVGRAGASRAERKEAFDAERRAQFARKVTNPESGKPGATVTGSRPVREAPAGSLPR
jgi:hypothetical protein